MDPETAAGETWGEMLLGGVGTILGFDWNEATAEQVWDKMFSAGGGLVLRISGAAFEQKLEWNYLGGDLFFGWDELFLKGG